MHSAIERRAEGAKVLVLFVRGLLGSSNRSSDLIKAVLARGVSSAAPLLPRHGKDACEFAKKGRFWAWGRNCGQRAMQGKYAKI